MLRRIFLALAVLAAALQVDAFILKQSTAFDRMVLMIDSTDHVTGKAGLTLTMTASKAGEDFASVTPTVTDRGNGWYELALTTSHTDTLGALCLHITGSGADASDICDQVIAFDLGDADPGVDVTKWTGTAVLSPDTAGAPKVTIKDGTGTGEIDTLSGAVVNVDLADTITTYTGNTLQTGDSFARLGAPAGVSVSADIAAIEAQTDDIGAAGAGLTAVTCATVGDKTGYRLSATGVDDVWDELLAGHTTSGSSGDTLSDAGALGDPWSTSLPGAYSGGTAGYIVGTTLNSANVTTTSPVNSAGTAISLVQGDDYKNADGTQLSFSSSSWSLTGHTVKLHFVPIANDTTTSLTITCTVSSATAAYCELTAAQTTALSVGQYSHALRVTRSSATVSTLLVGGRTTVVKTPNP